MKFCSLLLISFVSLASLAGCGKGGSKASASNTFAAVKLPEAVLGDFTGTAMLETGPGKIEAHGQAIGRISPVGERYQLEFLGGIPAISSGYPKLTNLIFAAAPGSQMGVYDSVSRDGSVEGIHLSSYHANLNVEVQTSQGKVVFTGMK